MTLIKIVQTQLPLRTASKQDTKHDIQFRFDPLLHTEK